MSHPPSEPSPPLHQISHGIHPLLIQKSSLFSSPDQPAAASSFLDLPCHSVPSIHPASIDPPPAPPVAGTLQPSASSSPRLPHAGHQQHPGAQAPFSRSMVPGATST